MRTGIGYALCAAFMLLCMWGVAAGEAPKGGPDHLAKEEEKHLKRLATIDRLEELAKEHKMDALLEKIKMMRENEQRRFDKACERLKREHGKSADSHKGGKKDDENKDSKGKHDEQAGGKDEKGRHGEGERDEKEKSEKGKETPAEGKGKTDEKDETKARHGKGR